MLKILNLNKQTNFWRLKEHLSSFTKLVTFQSSIIKVYLNLCVHQCLVSFVEKQHLCTPLICLADCSIPILLFFFFFALYLLCYSLFCLISFSIAMSFFFHFFLFSRPFCFLSSSSFAHICLFLFSFYLYIFWFWLLNWSLFVFPSSVSISLSLLLWKRLMVHYHIQCGLYSVRGPHMDLLNFIVYYHNIVK